MSSVWYDHTTLSKVVRHSTGNLTQVGSIVICFLQRFIIFFIQSYAFSDIQLYPSEDIGVRYVIFNVI